MSLVSVVRESLLAAVERCCRGACQVFFALGLSGVSPVLAELPASVLNLSSPATATSRSQLFVVHGRPTPAVRFGRVPPAVDLNPVIELQPQVLAITAERIQAAVLGRLGASPGGGRGRFHLFLIQTNQFGDGPLQIVPRPFREGWQYQVGVPETVDWRRLVRGLSEVVLLELANRAGTESFARTPLWLNEGLAGILTAEEGRNLIQEPEAAVVRTGRRGDPLLEVRSILAGSSPLTFAELSQPDAAVFANATLFTRFQASAVLLTQQLLREDGGPERVRQAVLLSPQFLNWELALLRAFDGRFLNALDVEKWWAVSSTAMLARDPLKRWTREQCLARLRELTVEAATVSATTNGPAARRQVSLGELIAVLDFGPQQDVFERKTAQLREVYVQAPDNLLPLVQDYHRTLYNYMGTRRSAGVDPSGRGQLEIRSQLLARQTARHLGELDRQLAALR